ncbi:hypothetical protein [Clostridium sp.]|uniref:zinc ribbon domain-containing protein n=1 Tax=Clostridium sp. TaxID=1506 RepID=UPI001A3933C7|nr:hypothetical protein [Clostridium sp.]MBK5242140.1 hypothetical protein [Clostridium sp.]
MGNKIQVAINHLKVGNFHQTHIDMAVECLEKQIPKAIKYDKNGQNECPICDSHVYTDDNYCFHCGQKLFTNLNNE